MPTPLEKKFKSFASEWSGAQLFPFIQVINIFRVNLPSISVAEEERSRLKASTKRIFLIKHFCTYF